MRQKKLLSTELRDPQRKGMYAKAFEKLKEIDAELVVVSSYFTDSTRTTHSLSEWMQEIIDSLKGDLSLDKYKPVIELIRKGVNPENLQSLKAEIAKTIDSKKEEHIRESLKDMQSEFNKLPGGDKLLRITKALHSLTSISYMAVASVYYKGLEELEDVEVADAWIKDLKGCVETDLVKLKELFEKGEKLQTKQQIENAVKNALLKRRIRLNKKVAKILGEVKGLVVAGARDHIIKALKKLKQITQEDALGSGKYNDLGSFNVGTVVDDWVVDLKGCNDDELKGLKGVLQKGGRLRQSKEILEKVKAAVVAKNTREAAKNVEETTQKTVPKRKPILHSLKKVTERRDEFDAFRLAGVKKKVEVKGSKSKSKSRKR